MDCVCCSFHRLPMSFDKGRNSDGVFGAPAATAMNRGVTFGSIHSAYNHLNNFTVCASSVRS